MPQRIISVLGCGWLGLPLARNLISLGYTVRGSTTSADKFKALADSGIIPYQISIDPPTSIETKDFFRADTLFLNIPFRRVLEAPSFYLEQINDVIQKMKGSAVKTVIFASSTSVYPDDCAVADERMVINPDDPRSIVLRTVENLLQSHKNFKTVILRFGGLYGGTRKIGKFLAGKKDIPDGESPVNLVHLDDCVAIVTAVIQRNIQNEIFNVCSDKHPTRSELYTQAAHALGLPVPQFSSRASPKAKIVSNEKVKKLLGYKFLHPDPIKL